MLVGNGKQRYLYLSRSFKNPRVKTLVQTVVVFIFGMLCVFNIVFNKRGLTTLFELNTLLPKMNENLDVLRAERLRLENQAELLRESSLDIDMLDEKARKILDLAKTKELILIPKYDDN